MIYVVKVRDNHLANGSLTSNCFFVQAPIKKGHTAPLKFFGIASPVLIALGLLYVTSRSHSITLHSFIQAQTTILGDL